MKVRIRFTKVGKVRWTSHRDVARMWERALRRAELPLAHTEGFTPRPKLAFGLALPTGHESLAEYLDVALTSPVDVAGLPALLTPLLPVGLSVTAAASLDPGGPSLQEDVESSTWEIEAVGRSVAEVRGLVEGALAAPELVIARTRKGAETSEDVRPGIKSVEVVGAPTCGYADHDPGALLVAELATHPRSLRPAELLAAISPDLGEGHVRRLHQWITRDGARQEPLAPAASPHALERAS